MHVFQATEDSGEEGQDEQARLDWRRHVFHIFHNRGRFNCPNQLVGEDPEGDYAQGIPLDGLWLGFVLPVYFDSARRSLPFVFPVVLAVVPLGMVLPVRRISIQRGGTVGEILYQAGLFALGLAVLISLIWGLVGEEYKIHIAVGITALGLGDASAALIGKYFGKTKLRLKLFDRRKTIEGSLAMTGFAFIGIFVLLLLFTDIHIGLTLATALVLACLSAFLEAVAVHGLDTILIPLIIAFSSLRFRSTCTVQLL